MLVKKGGCVYIITNKIHTVLYVGVTSNLRQRIWQHINKFYPESFTAKYNCNKLVWYESFASISEAIAREKQLKAGNRAKKMELIKELNPDWKDLWEEGVRHW
jgi:putative endonuclease